MNQKPVKYEVSEKDIDSVLRFLKATDPENATPEMAIALLEYFQGKIHELGHTDLNKLEQIYSELKKKKSNKPIKAYS